MADEMEYLQPSFEPSSITMPRLRNILMTHDITYPASAKKGELVDIFNHQLKPKARRILAAGDRVRRTSEGITHVPSSQESSTSGDVDNQSAMPPPPVPPTPRQRKPKKSGRATSEDQVSDSFDRQMTERGTSSKHGRQSDTEPEADIARLSARKSRKSEYTPKAEVHTLESTSGSQRGSEDVFSDENPFQRGSPPFSAQANRRKSGGTSSDRRKSSSNRRKTEGALPRSSKSEQKDGAVVPSSKTFEVPVSRIRAKQGKTESDDGIEPGEDFTPEAQAELSKERATTDGTGVHVSRRRKAGHRPATVPKSLPLLVVGTLLGGYATWYRQEKLAIGYCGIGSPSEWISNDRIPDWARVLQPKCEMCPQHATCFGNLKTECEDGFILRSHPLSLAGLMPLPPTCEPDGERARKVKAVADRAVENLRNRNAQAVCGTLKDTDGHPEAADIPEQQLKEAVKSQKRKGMTEHEFEDLWKGAMEEIVGREEVLQAGQSNEGVRYASNSLARISIGCGIRRSARLTLAKYKFPLSLIGAFLLITAYVRNRILESRQDRARIPELVTVTLDRLSTQATRFSIGEVQESWISIGQLRDDVLRDEFNDRRRGSLWVKVRDVVERNANVRASSRELRGGDVSRVWEWVGSLLSTEDLGLSGRRSGGKRVSWGGVTNAIETNGANGSMSPIKDEEEKNDHSRARVERRWNEGRPIY